MNLFVGMEWLFQMNHVMMAIKPILMAVLNFVSKRLNGTVRAQDLAVVNLYVEMGFELGLNNVMITIRIQMMDVTLIAFLRLVMNVSS